ncbi:MAG: hypothetical protein WC686_03740 [Candidatus Shapirobacteria bacterium]|jgi:hypothetical protein
MSFSTEKLILPLADVPPDPASRAPLTDRLNPLGFLTDGQCSYLLGLSAGVTGMDISGKSSLTTELTNQLLRGEAIYRLGLRYSVPFRPAGINLPNSWS